MGEIIFAVLCGAYFVTLGIFMNWYFKREKQSLLSGG
jgi:hypothetical protein